jgi:hypothetical protein
MKKKKKAGWNSVNFSFFFTSGWNSVLLTGNMGIFFYYKLNVDSKQLITMQVTYPFEDIVQDNLLCWVEKLGYHKMMDHKHV